MRDMTFEAKKQLRMLKRNRLPDRVLKRQWEPFRFQSWEKSIPKRFSFIKRTHRMKKIWTVYSGREIVYIERKGL